MNKKIVCLGITFVFCGMLCACGNENTASNIEEKQVTSIYADYPEYDNAQDLIDSSDLVFSGTVKNIKYEMLNVMTEQGGDSVTGLENSEDIPYTIYEIEVDTVYKGTDESEIISIKRPGGDFDGESYVVDGATEIALNETYLFVTKTFSGSYASLLNVSQASYDMNVREKSSVSDSNEIKLSQILEIFN